MCFLFVGKQEWADKHNLTAKQTQREEIDRIKKNVTGGRRGGARPCILLVRESSQTGAEVQQPGQAGQGLKKKNRHRLRARPDRKEVGRGGGHARQGKKRQNRRAYAVRQLGVLFYRKYQDNKKREEKTNRKKKTRIKYYTKRKRKH